MPLVALLVFLEQYSLQQNIPVVFFAARIRPARHRRSEQADRDGEEIGRRQINRRPHPSSTVRKG